MLSKLIMYCLFVSPQIGGVEFWNFRAGMSLNVRDSERNWTKTAYQTITYKANRFVYLFRNFERVGATIRLICI